MKLSIIIPVYNEEKTVEQLVKRVSKVSFSPAAKEIVIVNDRSTDTTVEKLQKIVKLYPEVKLYSHKKNKGKGAALRTGFSHATGDYLVIQDADLEYDPAYLVRLFKLIQSGKAEVVYGTRLKRLPHFRGEESRPRFLLHYLGNRFLSLVTSLLYGQWVTDIETCYKIFPRSVLKKIHLSGNGFDFEPEITAKLIKQGYTIVEVPIKATPRGYEEGKKLQTFPEGFRALWTLVKYRFTE